MRKVTLLLVGMAVMLAILPALAKPVSADNPAATTLVWTSGTAIFKAWGDGSNSETVISTPGRFAGEPSLSPDGRRIAFVAWDNGRVIKIVDLRLHRVFPPITSGTDSAPCWSPDGRYLVFAREMGGGAGAALFIQNVQNPAKPGPAIGLLDNAFTIAEGNPSWRGDFLAYDSYNRATDDIMTVRLLNMRTGEKQLFAGNPNTSANNPEISPDGKWVAYEATPQWTDEWGRTRYGEIRVHIKRIADGLDVELLNFESYFPAWAPDSQSIYFTSTIDGTVATYVADIDENGGLTRVAWIAGEPFPDYAYWPSASWAMRPIRAIYTPFTRLP